MHRLLVEVEVRFATSTRTQSLKRTRNGMRSSTRLVVTSNMQTHVLVWASRTKCHLVPTWDSESFGEFWHEAWGFGEIVQDWMSEQGWYSDWKDIEVCFQFSLVCIKSSLQTFYMYMPDSCGTLSNQLFWNSVLQQKVGKIHFDCGQTCFEEELNFRLKGGPVIER